MIEYKDDKQLEGVQTFENGDVYQGAFKDGKKHGKGILRTRNDRSYEGEWKYDKPHGFCLVGSEMCIRDRSYFQSPS